MDELLGALFEFVGGFVIELFFALVGELLSDMINGPNPTLDKAWWNTLKL